MAGLVVVPPARPPAASKHPRRRLPSAKPRGMQRGTRRLLCLALPRIPGHTASPLSCTLAGRAGGGRLRLGIRPQFPTAARLQHFEGRSLAMGITHQGRASWRACCARSTAWRPPLGGPWQRRPRLRDCLSETGDRRHVRTTHSSLRRRHRCPGTRTGGVGKGREDRGRSSRRSPPPAPAFRAVVSARERERSRLSCWERLATIPQPWPCLAVPIYSAAPPPFNTRLAQFTRRQLGFIGAKDAAVPAAGSVAPPGGRVQDGATARGPFVGFEYDQRLARP